MIRYFTIYGERCSGTNYLQHAMLENFQLTYTSKYGWKHFFGFYDFTQEEKDEPLIENTLFIGIVRDPLYWLNSFSEKLHHIPTSNRQSIYSFLWNEHYSVSDHTNAEIMEDHHIYTHQRYKNIFELRSIKNRFLIEDMPTRVKHYLLIRYEDLTNHYEKVLNFFYIKFHLIKKKKNM